MRFDKLTTKFQQAFADAQSLAMQMTIQILNPFIWFSIAWPRRWKYSLTFILCRVNL